MRPTVYGVPWVSLFRKYYGAYYLPRNILGESGNEADTLPTFLLKAAARLLSYMVNDSLRAV